MIYAQALKFISKQVYVISGDTTVLYGILTSVSGTTAKIQLNDDSHVMSHIKYVYPK